LDVWDFGREGDEESTGEESGGVYDDETFGEESDEEGEGEGEGGGGGEEEREESREQG
jgi:hypothetical protein